MTLTRSTRTPAVEHTFSQRFQLTLSLGLAVIFLLCQGLAASLHAQTITVDNKLANHYSYSPFPSACPNGQPVSNIPSGYHIERPHVIFNASTNTWVLWAHYDNSSYTTAEALVATSPNQCGPFIIDSEFQPLGYQIRDDYVFEDTDGSAYFIAASNKNGGANDTMAIFKLTSDYLNVDSTAGVNWVFNNGYREAPVVIRNGNNYFLFTSQAAGWFPSQGGYATSTNMMGAFSALSNLGNSSTFGGQESGIITVNGTSTTSYILTFDHLGGNISHDDGDTWLPVTINGTTATLEWYTSYQVNLTTGVLTLPQNTDLALGKTATASSTASTSSASNVNDGSYATEWVASSSTFPAWWMVDLGSTQTIGEIDTSWYMYKGSEAYYQYKIDYSTDGTHFTTIDRTGNQFYGFTTDQVYFNARYVKIELNNAVLQNNPNNWYTPQLYEVKMLAPADTVISVPNYSFETPTTSTYVYNPSGGSWTFSGASGNGSGVTTNNSGFTAGNPPAPLGSQVAFIQGSATITQSLSGFTVGNTYTVTLSAAQRANKSGGQAGQTFNLLVNGTVIGSFAPPQTATSYQDYTATFTASATTNTLQIAGTDTNGGDNTILLDNVRITTPIQ